MTYEFKRSKNFDQKKLENQLRKARSLISKARYGRDIFLILKSINYSSKKENHGAENGNLT